MQHVIRIHFLSDWCITGPGSRHEIADRTILRDADGLPMIPGRTVKGMLREGGRLLCLSPLGDRRLYERLFGGEDTTEEGITVPTGTPGAVQVGTARIDPAIRRAIAEIPDEQERRRCLEDLTLIRFQTALEDGTVKPQTLRSTECAIPGLSFTATVSLAGPARLEDENAAWTFLKQACAMIRAMGVGRNRGLGRVRFHLETEGGAA